MRLILTILAVFLLLVANEAWCRTHKTDKEHSRKFVHITVGSFVAFWPFFLSWHQIETLSLVFLAGVAVSKYFGVFPTIHSVKRPTWGEVFFALAVGIIAVVTKDKWIYAAALLQMSLADGMAAVIGIRFGKRNAYRILGHTKSAAGTLTFFVLSFGVLLGYGHWSHASLSVALMAVYAAAATLLENIAVKGSDNLLVPLLLALLLTN